MLFLKRERPFTDSPSSEPSPHGEGTLINIQHIFYLLNTYIYFNYK